MSNIRDEIVYDVEKKRTIIEKILLTIINLPQIPELYELCEMNSKDMKYIKKEEFVAIYSLALEVRKSMILGSKRNTRLEEYLWRKDGSLNKRNLLKFVDYEVRDIIKHKTSNPKLKWRLSVNKIFKEIDRNEGKTKIYKIKD